MAEQPSRDAEHTESRSVTSGRAASPSVDDVLRDKRHLQGSQSAVDLPRYSPAERDGMYHPSSSASSPRRTIEESGTDLKRASSLKTAPTHHGSQPALHASSAAFQQDPKLLKKVKIFLDDKQKVKSRLASLYSYFGLFRSYDRL